MKNTSPEGLPASDAAWIMLNEVMPSGKTPHNSPSRYAWRAPSDETAAAIGGVFMSPVAPGTGQQFHRAMIEARMRAVAIEFDFVQPVASGASSTSRASCGLIHCGKPAAAPRDRRAICRAMPGPENDYPKAGP